METLTNSEKKLQKWSNLYERYKHLEQYCDIVLDGIDDESIYFHPRFVLDENTYITSQSDVGDKLTGGELYAMRLFSTVNGNNIGIEIYDDIFDNIVIGYHTNRDVVILAATTLSRVKNHINQLNMYVNDYVTNILIGSSLNNITQNFISELQAVNNVVSFMRKSDKINKHE